MSAEDYGACYCRTEGEEESLEPVDVNWRTSDLLEKTHISELRGRDKVTFLSSCRLCKGTQSYAVPPKNFQQVMCFRGCREVRGRGRGQEVLKRSLHRASSFPRALVTMVEPDRIPSLSRDISARWMDVVAQEIRESRSSSDSRAAISGKALPVRARMALL